MSYEPLTVTVSVRTSSDTYRNVEKTSWFGLMIPPAKYDEQVLHTAKPLPYGEMELTDVGLDWTAVTVPRGIRGSAYRQPGLKIPVVDGMPFMICLVHYGDPVGDHTLFVAEVKDHGGIPEDGVKDVMIHRGKNKFFKLGDEYSVTPY